VNSPIGGTSTERPEEIGVPEEQTTSIRSKQTWPSWFPSPGLSNHPSIYTTGRCLEKATARLPGFVSKKQLFALQLSIPSIILYRSLCRGREEGTA
jgi:hypothetical protein